MDATESRRAATRLRRHPGCARAERRRAHAARRFAALSQDGSEAFLFESVERGENVGRYSFVGFDPRRSLRFDRDTRSGRVCSMKSCGRCACTGRGQASALFRRRGRYFGYGVAGWTERIPGHACRRLGIPDAKLLFFDNVVVFDHVRQRLYVIANIFTADATASLDSANARLDSAIEKVRNASVEPIAVSGGRRRRSMQPNMSRDEFESMVRAAKEEIVAGEIFQIVVSQRWETDFPTPTR